MMKFNDKQLNGLLKGVGEVPQFTTARMGKKMKPAVSASLYKGKGTVKGAFYGSKFDSVSEYLTSVGEKYMDKPIKEMEEGLLHEALALIEHAKEEGFELDLPTFARARQVINSGNVPSNPVELLQAYRTDLNTTSKPIDALRDELIEELEETRKYQLLNRSSYSLDWAIKETNAAPEVADYAARLQAEKDLVISKYQGIAESYQYPDYELAPAVLYANLYVLNIKAQQEKKVKDKERLVSALVNLYIEKNGVSPVNEDLAIINTFAEDKLKDKSEGGYSSIQSLFPLGAVQFLQWTKDGVVKTKRKAGKMVSAYFTSDSLLTEEDAAGWKALENTQVVVQNGFLNGLTLSSDDQLDMRDRRVSPSRKEVADKDEAMQEFLTSTKFLRGAKAWSSTSQSGVVLHVSLYKKGVKVYFGGMRNA